MIGTAFKAFTIITVLSAVSSSFVAKPEPNLHIFFSHFFQKLPILLAMLYLVFPELSSCFLSSQQITIVSYNRLTKL